jgi:hypothetical protein
LDRKELLLLVFRVLNVCKELNLLNPTGHLMHHQKFNIQQLYALPTLYLCVLYLSQNKCDYFIWHISCTVVVLTCFVMCGCVYVWVFLVICILVFTVFRIVCTVFLYCYVYVCMCIYIQGVHLKSKTLSKP